MANDAYEIHVGEKWRWGHITLETVEHRFWKHVDKALGCWVWLGAKNEKGYGLFKLGGKKGKAAKAHRVAWELVNGVIESSLHVLHRCDNRSCVNPDHLYLGTHQDNMRDMQQRGRSGIEKALQTRKLRHGY